MDIQIIALVLGSNVITAMLTVYANNRLRKSEVQSNEAIASETLSKTYATLIKSMNDEISRMKRINEDLAQQRQDLENHKNELIEKIHELEAEMDSLRKTVAQLNKRLKKYENGE